MKSTRSTDESTKSGKQITDPKRQTLKRVATVVAAVVLSGSGLIIINNRFTFNFNIFGWGQPDDEEVRPDDKEPPPDGREVRISVGEASTRCPQDATCSGLHRDYHYELIGDFDSAPHTLECWVDGSRRWSGIWSGPEYPERGCYMWGDGGEIVYVVVDGVKSNELLWGKAG